MKLDFAHMGTSLVIPERIDDNIYDPDLGEARSLDVLNGHLDFSNVKYSESLTGELPLSGIRRGALFRGKMVGGTLNADYYKRLVNYGSDDDINDDKHLEPIPGCAIEFYAPTSGTFILTWQVSASSDLDVFYPGDSSSQVVKGQRTFLTLMGAKDDDFELDEIGYRQYLPMCIQQDGGTGVTPARVMGMGRIWSGHHVVEVDARTWYRYGIGIYSSANMARIRVRNFKYLYFPNAEATIDGSIPDSL